MRCPNFEKLLDFLDGNLTASEAEPVAEHLSAGCAKCQATGDWFNQVSLITAQDDSVEPPAWVTKRALRIFETQKPRLLERFVQAIASLTFDSFARPAVVGVRATETANRQLLYNANAYSIDLQVAPLGGLRADLVGQVLCEAETSFESVAALTLELVGEDRKAHRTSTNAMGEFTIGGLKQGLYNLTIETPEGNITAYDIPVIQPE
jgi:hypothetical protein